MIRLMGREVQDEANPDGDIAIKYIGLRPGEKLFEELLIGGHTIETEHPRIRRNNEPAVSREEVAQLLEGLEAAMASGPAEKIQAMLMRSVGYQPDQPAAEPDKAPAWAPVSRTLH